VQCATDLRALTAFLSCGQARAAILRAKAAATVLKCVKRVGPRLGSTREAEKVLGILPLFLQDGNQETRHHGKAITSYLLSTVRAIQYASVAAAFMLRSFFIYACIF
jgi:hypothetical protein